VEYQGHNLRNPLFDQLARYAGQFAQPVYYADPGGEGRAAFKNGSGFFVRLAHRTVAVTCHHVLSDYRRRRPAEGSPIEFGRLSIDPEKYMLAEDRHLDLVTLDVSELAGRPGGVDPAGRGCGEAGTLLRSVSQTIRRHRCSSERAGVWKKWEAA
jgi:hypothetical protein